MKIRMVADWNEHLTNEEVFAYLFQLTHLMLWMKYIKYSSVMLNPVEQTKSDYAEYKDFGHHWIMDREELDTVHKPVLDWRI